MKDISNVELTFVGYFVVIQYWREFRYTKNISQEKIEQLIIGNVIEMDEKEIRRRCVNEYIQLQSRCDKLLKTQDVLDKMNQVNVLKNKFLEKNNG